LNRPKFVEAVRVAIERHRMISPGQTVVVAASGGPDSSALLHALWSLQSELDFSLVAATMDHGTRGAESRGDAEYVQSLCSQFDIPCHIEHADIPAIARSRRVSTSVAARDERHRFLRGVAAGSSAPGEERIALGHTSDDRAETVLMNILRGGGTDGMCAMPAVRLPIIRPILSCSRAQAAEYCTEMQITPRKDPSNATLDYRRNRIRLELLPYLAAYYNSGVKDALVRLAEIAEDDVEVLVTYAASLLTRATTSATASELVIDASILRAAPTALQRRAVRQAIGSFRGEMTDVDLKVVDSILSAVNGGTAIEHTLPLTGAASQTHVHAARDRVRIFAPPPAEQIEEWQVSMPVPGEIELPFGNRSISADVTPARKAHELMSAHTHEYGAPIHDGGTATSYFRRRILTDTLTVRSWRPGDRIQVKGMSGTKKLQDLYTDCKVPRSERFLIPVVCLACDDVEGKGTGTGTVVAVLGVRSSDHSLSVADLQELAVREPDEPVAVLKMVCVRRSPGMQ